MDGFMEPGGNAGCKNACNEGNAISASTQFTAKSGRSDCDWTG